MNTYKEVATIAINQEGFWYKYYITYTMQAMYLYIRLLSSRLKLKEFIVSFVLASEQYYSL